MQLHGLYKNSPLFYVYVSFVAEKDSHDNQTYFANFRKSIQFPIKIDD